MPTLRVVHSIERDTLERLSRIAATLAGGSSHEVLAAINRLDRNMAQRIAQVEAKFDEFVSVVMTALGDIEAAKAEAVRADDAEEDGALANFVAKIDEAIARIRPAAPEPTEQPVE